MHVPIQTSIRFENTERLGAQVHFSPAHFEAYRQSYFISYHELVSFLLADYKHFIMLPTYIFKMCSSDELMSTWDVHMCTSRPFEST